MLSFFRRLCARLPRGITLFTGALFLCILGILLLGQSVFSFAYRNGSSLSNLQLFLIVLLVFAAWVAGLVLWRRREKPLKGIKPRHLVLFLCIGNVLLFLVQLVYVRSLWFYPSWDPAACHEAALALALGHPIPDPSYFVLCPNNAPLTLALALPLWIGVQLGLAVPYLMLPIFAAMLVNLASLFCTLCIYRLTESRPATLFSYGPTSVFVLLSPYCTMPYTDAFAILFPVLTLYCYLSVRRPLLKWFLVGLFSAIGGAIKPTGYIVLIALLLLQGLRTLASLPMRKRAMVRVCTAFVALVLGLAPGVLFQRQATFLLAGSAKPEGQLSLTHYLMLGVNPDSYGGHSPADVEFSLSFPTLEERTQGNLQEFARRLTAMSPGEGLRFFSIKLYKAYNSGTFEWFGSHLAAEVPKRTDLVSLFLRSFYYSKGEYRKVFITVYQGLWLMILSLCALALFLARKKQPHLPALALTLLGLSCYLLLFEVWPRYMFLYAPFFTILASLGAKELSDHVLRRGRTACPPTV